MIDIVKLKEKKSWEKEQALEKDEALKRKDKLLVKALEQLLACEWEVSQFIIIEIQKELGITEE